MKRLAISIQKEPRFYYSVHRIRHSIKNRIKIKTLQKLFENGNIQIIVLNSSKDLKTASLVKKLRKLESNKLSFEEEAIKKFVIPI